MNRRDYLKSGATVGVLGLAGCQNRLDETDEGSSTSKSNPEHTSTTSTTTSGPPHVEVVTGGAESVDDDSVIIRGEIIEMGGTERVKTWFEYRDVINSLEWSTTSTQELDSPKIFKKKLEGLHSGTEFEFRAVAEVDGESDTGTVNTFSTTGRRVIQFNGDDTEDFVNALQQLKRYSKSTLEVEPGTYHLDPVKVTGLEYPPYFHIETWNLDDAIIEGNGATFVFTEPSYGGFLFSGGSELTLRNFTVDFDPVPFTQGQIVKLIDTKEKMTFEIDDGYPPLTHEMFDEADVFASIHTPDGEFISGIRAHGSPIKRFSSINHLSGQRWELSVRTDGRYNTRGLEEGRKLAIVARGLKGPSHAIRINQVKHPVVENVSVRASAGLGFDVKQCVGPVIRGVSLAPPPDSDRLIALDADGIMLFNCRKSPIIEDCHIERCLDDAMGVKQVLAKVVQIVDENTIELRGSLGPHFELGDALEAMSPSGVRKGTLPEISDIQNHFSAPRRPNPPQFVTFKGPINDRLKTGDLISNRSASNPNFVVRNNVIENNRARLIQITSGPGVVKNNELNGSPGYSIMLRTDTRGVFSPQGWVENVEIRNNTINRPGMTHLAGAQASGISLFHATADGVPNEGRPNRNITIVENKISNSAHRGITLRDTEKIKIKNNNLNKLNMLEYGYVDEGILLDNVTDASIISNLVKATSPRIEHFGRRRNSQHVVAEDNNFVLDGEEQPAQLIKK